MRRGLIALLLAGLAVGAGFFVWRQRHPAETGPSPARLGALRQERDTLDERLRELASGPNGKGLDDGQKGSLLIGIPTSFTRSLIEQLVTGLFGEVHLRLRDLRVHKADEVKGKVLFGMRTFGRYELDVLIREARGVLRPKPPRLEFAKQRIELTLPLRLAEGGGQAELRLKWDSRGLAGAVCGDFEVAREVEGSVVPREYRVAGAFEVAAEGGAIVLTPRFRPVTVNLLIEPSAASWRSVDSLIEERGALCRKALGKVDVRQKLEQVIGRGFEIKLPPKLFRPIRLPAGVQQSLDLQGIALALDLKPAGLSVGQQRIWYGVDVETRQAGGPRKP